MKPRRGGGGGRICNVCEKDEGNNGNMVTCVACVNYFHTVCLKTPPSNIFEWKCESCISKRDARTAELDCDDILKSQVKALPESVKSRFGEICWAQGGSGYGWWPSLIYDPCRAGEPARTQARRNLGSRFLVYFMECPESPFSILEPAQIKSWTQGLSEDFHLGKSAKYGGKMKLFTFQKALLAAMTVNDKPLEDRLVYSNQDDQEEPEQIARRTRNKTTKLVEGSPRSAFQPIHPGGGVLSNPSSSSGKREPEYSQRESRRRRISNEETFHYNGKFVVPIQPNAEEEGDSDESGDGEMVCKIILKASQGRKEKSVGIVIVPSIRNCTFADVRVKIKQDLCGDLLQANLVWKFFLMEAGVPVSGRQETGLGPVYAFLSKARNGTLGRGTVQDPVLIYISDKYNTSV